MEYEQELKEYEDKLLLEGGLSEQEVIDKIEAYKETLRKSRQDLLKEVEELRVENENAVGATMELVALVAQMSGVQEEAETASKATLEVLNLLSLQLGGQ